MSATATFFIETLGCPKNRADSRQMRSRLLSAGLSESACVQKADFILINSCVFVREAQEETIEEIFVKTKSKKKNAKIILVGCFAQKYAQEVKKEIPEVDLAIGTGHYHEIAEILARHFSVQLSAHSAATSVSAHSVPAEEILPHAYIRVAQGCSRSCSFCIIPFIRGSYTPLKQEDMERQYQEELALRQTAQTYIPLREIILVSQDTVNQSLDDLRCSLDFFSAQEEIQWIRLHYLFPDKRVLDILRLYREYPKLVSYLDMPLQHVAPTLLKRMKRPHDVALFHEIFAAAREARSDMETRSSFIVGFPDESEEEFSALETFVREFTEPYALQKLSLFRYSHESQTPAEKIFTDSVKEQVKIDRMNRLRNIHLEARLQSRKAKTDTIETMLVESVTENEISARRAFDSPEIDELVFVSSKTQNNQEKRINEKNIKKTFSPHVGDFIKVKLLMPMEYDWLGEFAVTDEVHYE